MLIKVPKNFELLHFYLASCQAQLAPDTEYLLAGMSKYWPISWLNWLEEHSHYQQLPLHKKARLVKLKLKALPKVPLWRGYDYADLNWKPCLVFLHATNWILAAAYFWKISPSYTATCVI